MFRGRRKAAFRRAVALGAAVIVQVWSLAPVAASVIYCIGDDGHAGFELMKAGARGCAACCHEELAAGDAGMHVEDGPVSECTDIAMAPSDGLATKSSDTPPASPLVALLPVRVGAALPDHEPVLGDIPPPRGSPTRMLRRTVLLI